MDDISTFEASALVTAMRNGTLSAEAVMQATLARIAAVNGPLNAIVSLRGEDALLAEARAVDDGADRGPLHGLPLAVKDLSNVAGLPTSQGSPAFAGEVAAEDSLFVARMRAAGAVFIGKTNTPEFGLGSQTYNPVHGVTVNPYDTTRTCGGSSGGAAVALAAGMVSLADGSDMMGSLRNPAGWCNVYGFRPSWGRVPREPGGDMFLHRLSTEGPMARSPADLALLLTVMAGSHPQVPPVFGPETFAAHGAIAGTRIGWLGDWGGALPMEEGILPLCETALAVFEGLGCTVEPVAPPFSRDALWESWTGLRSWALLPGLAPLMEDQQTRGQLKPEALWEAECGLALSGADIQRLSEIRSDWFSTAATLFERYDALVLPTAQVWPFAHDIAWPRAIAGQPMDTYHRWMEVVIPASLLGLPALAVPAGFGDAGLPMEMQLIGRYGDDGGILALAGAYHQATRWPQLHPPKFPGEKMT